MAKTKKAYLNAAASAKKRGDKIWAQAKQAEKDGENGKATNLYESARTHYATEEKAKKSALSAPD